jgi:hypothetical protein
VKALTATWHIVYVEELVVAMNVAASMHAGTRHVIYAE